MQDQTTHELRQIWQRHGGKPRPLRKNTVARLPVVNSMDEAWLKPWPSTKHCRNSSIVHPFTLPCCLPLTRKTPRRSNYYNGPVKRQRTSPTCWCSLRLTSLLWTTNNVPSCSLRQR